MKILCIAPLDLTTSAGLSALGCSVSAASSEKTLASSISDVHPDIVLMNGDVGGDAVPDDFRGLVIRSGGAEPPLPDLGAAETADLVFQMAEDAVMADSAYHERAEAMSAPHPLHGLVLGLIGFGEVGKHMRDRAEEKNMPVVVYSSHLADEGADEHRVRRMPDVKSLAAQADIISVHEPLRGDTVGLLDDLFFAAMKPSAILINTSSALLFDRRSYLDHLSRRQGWLNPAEIAETQDFPPLGIIQQVQKYRSDRIGM